MINERIIMSNFVYGYAVLAGAKQQFQDIKKLIEAELPIGVHPTTKGELFGFEESEMPGESEFVFLVGDSPESDVASYLIDFIDYVEGGNIGLPLSGKDRLEILHAFVQKLFVTCAASKVLLAVTDSSQIEERKPVALEEFFEVLVSDFEEYDDPPDCLYIIEKNFER